MKMTASLLPATQPAGPMRLAAVLFSVPRTVPVRHCDRRMAYGPPPLPPPPPPNAALSFGLQAKPEERKFPENFKKRLVFVEAAGPPRSTAIGRGAPSLTHSLRAVVADRPVVAQRPERRARAGRRRVHVPVRPERGTWLAGTWARLAALRKKGSQGRHKHARTPTPTPTYAQAQTNTSNTRALTQTRARR